MTRLREPSVGLTPDKPRGRHVHPRNLPSVQESPLDRKHLGDDDPEGQDGESDSSGVEGNRKTLASEAERPLVAELDPVAQATEDEVEDADTGQEARIDRGHEGDLVRAGDGLVIASGRIGGVAQRLQGEPATPKGRDNPFGDSAGIPEEDSSSEAEAERSAARLNAVTRLSIRSRQDSSTQPTNPRDAERNTAVAYQSSRNHTGRSIAIGTSPIDHPYTNNTTDPSRAPKTARKSTIPAPTMAQSLSPSKRKRGTEARPSTNPIRECSGPRGGQASGNSITATSTNQPSGSQKLQRPKQIYHNMTAPHKIQKVTPRARTDIYVPQLSPEETRAATKQGIKTTRAGRANSKTLHARGRSPIGTRTRRAGGSILNQQPPEEVQQEGDAEDQLLEAEEDGVETAEPTKKLRGVRSRRQKYASPIASSAVLTAGRITRTNPTGDRTMIQNSASEQVDRPVSPRPKNASRVTSQKTGAEREVARVVSADPRRSTGMEIRASGGALNTAEGLRRGADQERRREHHEQPPPDHHIRQGHEDSARITLPTNMSISQSSDVEGLDSGNVAQPREANDSDAEGYVHLGNNLSAEEKLELIMDYIYDIRDKRGPTRDCRTEVIKDFLNDVDDMRLLYTKLGKQERGTNQYDKLREELDKGLEIIKDQSHLIVSQNIRILPKEDSTIDVLKEKRATLEDLYTWAIPDLILAIKKAVGYYPDHSIPSSELRRIIGLQDVAINLGDSKWRREVRPGKESREHLKRLSHVVLPNIKKLRQDYKEELEERRRARDRCLKENLRRRIADEERRRREREREIKRRRRIINDQVLSELARTDPKYSANRRSQSQRRGDDNRLSGQDGFAGNKTNDWPKAELLALVQGLERFTGRDRYAQIVQEHCGPGGVLQSRSMDELFEKAKEFKADVYGDWELHPDDGPLPDYILSI
ncbi:MAG: hypothetical protein M1840_004413 [Geoglossum simile]|nr:MAG: hypothetical protein M1840_004413 [Geoglossum simile]